MIRNPFRQAQAWAKSRETKLADVLPDFIPAVDWLPLDHCLCESLGLVVCDTLGMWCAHDADSPNSSPACLRAP